jgi:hypothetical protein
MRARQKATLPLFKELPGFGVASLMCKVLLPPGTYDKHKTIGPWETDEEVPVAERIYPHFLVHVVHHAVVPKVLCACHAPPSAPEHVLAQLTGDTAALGPVHESGPATAPAAGLAAAPRPGPGRGRAVLAWMKRNSSWVLVILSLGYLQLAPTKAVQLQP